MLVFTVALGFSFSLSLYVSLIFYFLNTYIRLFEAICLYYVYKHVFDVHIIYADTTHVCINAQLFSPLNITRSHRDIVNQVIVAATQEGNTSFHFLVHVFR